MSSPFIIAEIGVNHNGSISLAKRLIDVALQAGADAVKFQTFVPEILSSALTPKTKYQIKNDGADSSHLEMLSNLTLSEDEFKELYSYTVANGLKFISTPYDIDSAEFLNNTLDVDYFKIASADIVDIPLLEYVASTRKSIILSTGMATLGEIEKAFLILKPLVGSQLSLLHCVSNYPCSDQSLNLNVIPTLRCAFNVPVGFSDHSVDGIAAISSVALGASIIEKHITLSKEMVGPDHSCSMEPDEFTSYVASLRRAYSMLGSPVKSVQSEEKDMRSVSRKSLHASRDIEVGELLSDHDFYLTRPGTGLHYEYLECLIGKYSRKAFRKGEMITLDAL